MGLEINDGKGSGPEAGREFGEDDSKSHPFLKKAVEAFQKKCLGIFPRRVFPGPGDEIRDGYKEIRNRLTEVKATQQLVQEKYRSYAGKTRPGKKSSTS